jgi:hypothetical protein
MVLKTVSRVAFAMLGATLIAMPVAADETGLASIHSWRREKGKTCFVDHFHYGTSEGEKTRKAAVAAAVRSWADFTDFEYGSDWAKFSKAASKSIKCTQSNGWGCNIEARPCR